MACCFDSNPGCQRVNRWVMYGLNFLVWIFSVVTLASCKFLMSSRSHGYGLFSSGQYGDCKNYDLEAGDADGAFAAARAFGVMANLLLILAFVASTFVLFGLHDKFAKIFWHLARAFYSFALLFVMLTFVVLADFRSSGYTPGVAFALNAVNVILLIIILCMGCCTPVPDERIFKRGGGVGYTGGQPASSANEINEVPRGAANTAIEVPNIRAPQFTRTVQILPSGQRKVTEETLHPDGIKEVTEWTEEGDVDDEESETVHEYEA